MRTPSSERLKLFSWGFPGQLNLCKRGLNINCQVFYLVPDEEMRGRKLLVCCQALGPGLHTRALPASLAIGRLFWVVRRTSLWSHCKDLTVPGAEEVWVSQKIPPLARVSSLSLSWPQVLYLHNGGDAFLLTSQRHWAWDKTGFLSMAPYARRHVPPYLVQWVLSNIYWVWIRN